MTDINEVYRDRNQAAFLAAALAWDYGFLVGKRIDPAAPGYPVLVIAFPTFGEVSWHIPEAEWAQAPNVPAYERPYDGHTTEQKQARIAAFLAEWFR